MCGTYATLSATPGQLPVSIVLTTFNRAGSLGPTVRSILGQSYTDFELIISDDCSTDDTSRVANQFARRDPRIRYRRNETNLGMPRNLNAGIRASYGWYVANVHDGDVFEPEMIAEWVRALDRCPEAAFVFNAYRVRSLEGVPTVFRESIGSCICGRVLLEQLFFWRWRFYSPVWGTVMARRAAYEAVGLFDPQYGFVADVDMWMRLAERYGVAYVDRPLIRLADPRTLPRQNAPSFWAERRLLEKMFWAARKRHYEGRLLRLGAEAVRHAFFVMASRTWFSALRLRSRIWKADDPGPDGARSNGHLGRD